MARVTVEDCVTIIPNRFKLCLIANNRAKNILSGASTTLDITEKPPVIALREIAENLVNIEKIENNIIESIQKRGKNTSSNEEVSKDISSGTEKIINDNPKSEDNIFVEDNLSIDD